MPSIHYHVANATGELDNLLTLIDTAVKYVSSVAEDELHADKIDIIFVSAPALAMKEYGIGGNSPGPNHIYISFDPASDKITYEGLVDTLLHEIHHCMRWRDPGYGETLGEVMVTEGLACLYEEEHRGEPPVYATVQLSDDDMQKAKKLIGSKDYDHSEWFFGSGKVARWFGYTYGYQLCKEYSTKGKLSAADMVNIQPGKIVQS